MRRRLGPILVAAGVLLAGLQARAQPDLRDQAQRHFDQGVAFFEGRDFEGALSEFEAAQRVLPNPRNLRNIAATLEAMRRYVDAIAAWERYAADPGVTAAERRQAEAQLRGLRTLLARMEILVQPPGAEVLVDGRLVGTAPLAEPVAVATGPVRITVRLARYRTVEREVRVAAGSMGREEFVLEPLPARLHLESNAPGARASVNGRETRAIPLDEELAPGNYDVHTEAPGFRDDTTRIVLGPDEDRTLTIVLERPPASLRLDVSPASARVLIDGEPRARAGRSTLSLPGGSHRVHIEGEGLLPWDGEIDLDDGGHHHLRARLGRDRLWVKPAWFWGAAVTTIALGSVGAVTGIRVLLLNAESAGEHPRQEWEDLLQEKSNLVGVTNALLVGTAAAAIGTFILYLYSRGEPPAPDVRFR